MLAGKIQEDVKEFLHQEVGLDAQELTPDDRLFSTGMLNSLDILELVSFIEKKYEIKIDTWEISLEKFDTLSEISTYVASKL